MEEVQKAVDRLSSDSTVEEIRNACRMVAYLPADYRLNFVVDIAKRIPGLNRWDIRREVGRQFERILRTPYDRWGGPTLNEICPDVYAPNWDRLKIPPGYRIKENGIFREKIDSMVLVSHQPLFIVEMLNDVYSSLQFVKLVFKPFKMADGFDNVIVPKKVVSHYRSILRLVNIGLNLADYFTTETVRYLQRFCDFNANVIPIVRFDIRDYNGKVYLAGHKLPNL